MAVEQSDTTAMALEARLELLEKQTFRKKQRRKRILLYFIAILLVVALLAGILVWHKQSTSFSHRLKALNVGYTLYAPPATVGAYTLDQDSLRNNNGFVTFSMKNGQQAITLTEQEAPPNPPDLSDFKGFDELDLRIGDGVVGQIEGRTISVIITDAAIINITSSSGVSKDTVSTVALSIRPMR